MAWWKGRNYIEDLTLTEFCSPFPPLPWSSYKMYEHLFTFNWNSSYLKEYGRIRNLKNSIAESLFYYNLMIKYLCCLYIKVDFWHLGLYQDCTHVIVWFIFTIYISGSGKKWGKAFHKLLESDSSWFTGSEEPAEKLHGFIHPGIRNKWKTHCRANLKLLVS